MRPAVVVLLILGIAAAIVAVRGPVPSPAIHATVHQAVAYDVSPPLASIAGITSTAEPPECEDCVADPGDPDDPDEEDAPQQNLTPSPAIAPSNPAGAAVEQRAQGTRPAAKLIESFDGLGAGFTGPEGVANGRNPSDNSLAIGPNHIVQTVNSRMAIFDKKGKVLYGAVVTNSIFKGFGGPCESRVSGDAVVRYDQLAGRWLFVLPIFQRIADRPEEPYSMCYAVSTGPDPMGSYHRYEFRRKLFPDYPRPAIWPDGYYVPTSTGDDVIQKHICIVDRARMLQGGPATEQCVIIDGVNFLSNADIDGFNSPPAGAPNIMLAAGGSQLRGILEDDGIYAYSVHVDWNDPKKTSVTGPKKIAVAPYHYLCNGQLTNCVPQPDTERRLDAQGDKIMQRVVYRNWGGHESIIALHSINTEAGSGGVRWYEFRLHAQRDPVLYQQSTYAPDQFYRWMPSPGMDHQGNIGIGYSFGGTPNFAGQRFAGRLAGDPPGVMTFHETVLAEGNGSQTNTHRWEDYTTTAMDPSDDCTFWYVGDYYKAGSLSYLTRIGAFRLPGCLQTTVRGAAYFDANHNGLRDTGEPFLPGHTVEFAGRKVTSGADGSFVVTVSADPAYGDLVPDSSALNIAAVCEVPNTGGADARFWYASSGALFWSRNRGKSILNAHDPAWRTLVNSTMRLSNADGSRLTVPDSGAGAVDQFQAWLRDASARKSASAQLAAAALNAAFGSQDTNATVHDPVVNDWPTIRTLIERANAANGSAAEAYGEILKRLNSNIEKVTPSDPRACPAR